MNRARLFSLLNLNSFKRQINVPYVKTALFLKALVKEGSCSLRNAKENMNEKITERSEESGNWPGRMGVGVNVGSRSQTTGQIILGRPY